MTTQHWNMLIAENQSMYESLAAHPQQQRLLCQSLVIAVQRQSPPGRFLEPHGNVWREMEDPRRVQQEVQWRFQESSSY